LASRLPMNMAFDHGPRFKEVRESTWFAPAGKMGQETEGQAIGTGDQTALPVGQTGQNTERNPP
jgi:hypothetical protein